MERKPAKFWQPVPYSWTCRPWNETRRLMIRERLLREFLNYRSDAEIVGIELEEGGNAIGRLFGFDGRVVYVFNPHTASLEKRILAEGAADELRVETKPIEHHFPEGDLTFRTRRQKCSDTPNPWENSLYGAEFWVGGETNQ